MRLAAFAVVVLASLDGCGGAEVLSIGCVNDSECDDHVFCNGAETCQAMGGSSTACVRTARDCSAMSSTCGPGICDEGRRECMSSLADADGDGGVSSLCCTGGACGDDCDDNDASRYAGATEVCDLDDEDCNDTTYGADADRDGYESAACCNGPGNCGLDCDDSRVSVNPSGSEICNGIDDDCNGSTDEGVSLPLYLDFDRDGYGVAGGTPVYLCAGAAGYSTLNNDCDDKNVAITPGAMECFLTPQTAFNVRICSSAGSWVPAACPVAKPACIAQPNGLGVCE